MQQVTTLKGDTINRIYVDGVGSVTVGTTLLPRGVYSAWSPTDKILVLDQSLSAGERLVALSRWSSRTAQRELIS